VKKAADICASTVDPRTAVAQPHDLSRCPVHGHPVLAICARCGIRGIAVCAALSDRELRDLEAIMTHRRLESGRSLVVEGDSGDHAFNVIFGAVKLYKSPADGRAQITGYLLPGDFLGLPLRGSYAFSAEAVAPTELCQFPREPLRRVFEKYDKLQQRFLTAVHDDLVAAQDHMLLLGRKTASERVCTFLVRLLQRSERIGAPVNPLHLPLHRNDIADYLGLTIETVSRTFTKLRSEAVIRLDRADKVFVLDRARLEDMAGGI
jgi:CRP/FNR family transcriptional regulator